jgi:cyclopropane-fatty-acyl-phospholipid synthase
MALIGKLIAKLIRTGSITIVMPNGSRPTFGPGGGKNVVVRFADRRVALEIVRNPRLGVGET